MDLSTSTVTRPTAEEIGIALRAMGARAEASGSVVSARRNGTVVDMRLCRDNIPFIWWTDSQGEYHQTITIQYALDALGISDIDLRSLTATTVIVRVLRELGLSNRNLAGKPRHFSVRGEYTDACKTERAATVADLHGEFASSRVVDAWPMIQRVLALTPYTFYLRDVNKVFYYLTTRP